jgi:hypothetical protein
MVLIDPKFGEECHREIHHLLRLGYNDGLAFETAKLLIVRNLWFLPGFGDVTLWNISY